MDLIKTFDTDYCIQYMAYDCTGKRMAQSDDQNTIRVFALEKQNK